MRFVLVTGFGTFETAHENFGGQPRQDAYLLRLDKSLDYWRTQSMAAAAIQMKNIRKGMITPEIYHELRLAPIATNRVHLHSTNKQTWRKNSWSKK